MAEAKLSELERTLRFDSEYFQKKYAEVYEALKAVHTEKITELSQVSDGNHFSISEDFEEDGIPYYRGQDVVGKFFIEQANPNYISEAAYLRPFMYRSHLQKGDVLLSIIGTIGELSLVSSEGQATCSCKLAILRPKEINPAYLAVFLQPSYGKQQTQRLIRGAVQMGLILEDMDQIHIARFSDGFEGKIAQTVADAKSILEESASLQSQAESLLLFELGLEQWQPPEPLTYERSSKDVMGAGRLDAEHYQERYYALVERLRQFTGGVKTIGEIANDLTNGVEIREYQESGVPYLRVADAVNLDISDEKIVYVDAGRAEEVIEKVKLDIGDVLASRSGSLAVTAVVEEKWKDSLISSHLIRLRIADNNYDPYYLAPRLGEA